MGSCKTMKIYYFSIKLKIHRKKWFVPISNNIKRACIGHSWNCSFEIAVYRWLVEILPKPDYLDSFTAWVNRRGKCAAEVCERSKNTHYPGSRDGDTVFRRSICRPVKKNGSQRETPVSPLIISLPPPSSSHRSTSSTSLRVRVESSWIEGISRGARWNGLREVKSKQGEEVRKRWKRNWWRVNFD